MPVRKRKPLSEFPAELFALVGAITAHCGGIERCMMGVLAYGRDVKKVAVTDLYNSASQRNKAWLNIAETLLIEDKPAASVARQMAKKTDQLFELRSILSHSLWSETDIANTLYLNQAREKRKKYYFRSIPIGYGQLVQWHNQAEILFGEHVDFLVLKILKLPPERAKEAFSELEWPPYAQEQRPTIGMP